MGLAELSKQEIAVLRLVAHGKENSEIADDLHLSQHTIRNYIFSISQKANVSKRYRLAIYAIKAGIVHLDDIQMNEVQR